MFWSLVSVFSLEFWRAGWLCAACFPGLLSWCDHSERLMVLEAGILEGAEGGKAGVAGLCDPLRLGSDRKESPLQAYCCRTGHETGGTGS